MELFGYLTFAGDVQVINSQNSLYGNEPFYVRELCVHTFSTTSRDGQIIPFLRGAMLRLTGRAAQTFNLAIGSMVVVDYGTSVHTFLDQSGQLRALGHLNINRIAEVTQSDLDALQRIMAGLIKT